MNVFISWSGEKSKAFAKALRDWIEDLFPSVVKPWMSEVDIDAGSRWSSKINDALQDTHIGIICVTKGNLTSPWLLFEAGALAKSVKESYVVPYLLDLGQADIPQGPLSQFQAKKADKKGTFELISTLNELLAEQRRPVEKLKKAFDKWWDDLERALSNLPVGDPKEEEPKRKLDDKIDEILSIVRDLKRKDVKKLSDIDEKVWKAVRDKYGEDIPGEGYWFAQSLLERLLDKEDEEYRSKRINNPRAAKHQNKKHSEK